MNERDLKYFCSLVETGNYTATATKFHVTQPAISAALRRLEEEYQAVLLTQANHRPLPPSHGWQRNENHRQYWRQAQR
ncbi:hypothetical protein WP50_15005 [Lactiplantibacillus plantarum]|nr:hypothetical protein WP50_15005 [Lactiplantibacillus plantarum]